MQPSATWGTPTGYYLGLNTRTGASDLSNADFNDYPAFILALNNNFPLSDKGIVQSFIETDKLQLNTAITDWSIAYTAVDNPELGQCNVGVYLSDPDIPAYTTNPDNYAKIAFLSSYSYTTILQNIVTNIPNFTNYTLDFWQPPYSNSRKIWSPNAAPKSGSGDMGTVYQQANYNGYANIIYSFGVKSLFLEIRVDTVNINTRLIEHYTLKGYNALTATEKAEKAIAKAYALVYRRGDTNGTYTYASGDHRDNFRLVLSEPLHGENDGGGIYDYYINTTAYIGLTEPLILPIFGNYKDDITDVRYNITENAAVLFYGHNKVDNIIQRQIDAYDRYTFYTMQGSDDNIEWIRKTCAAYGLFFCDDAQVSESVNLADSSSELTRWTHNDMMLGIIEEDGYTRGNYSRGADNALQSQFNWTDSTESTFDPSVTPVPTENEYSHATVFNSIGDLATLTKRYVLNDSDIQLLGTELFKVTDDIFTQYSDMKDYVPKINSAFLTNNPLDCIVSLQKYPIEIPKAATPENIRLGSIQTNALGYKFDAPCLTFLFGGKPIFPRFGNSFLDYNPFTRFEIYVPFCGTVDLNPADILNRVLNVELIVDMSTGTCTGYIESDDLVIETVNGNLAIDIPVSGIDAATVNANLNNAAVNARTAFNNKRANSGLMNVSNNVGIMDVLQPWKWGGKATSITASSLNSGYAAQKANYDLMHMQAPVHVIGSVSPVGAWAIDLNCRLLVYYPTGNIFDLDSDGLPVFNNKLSQFGALQGFATAETGNLNQYKGLTIAVEPRYTNMTTNSTTNPRALSADELDLITAALSEGIINNIS